MNAVSVQVLPFRRRRRRFAAALTAVALAGGLVAAADAGAHRGLDPSSTGKLQDQLERLVQAQPTFPGAALAVTTPRGTWSGAAGVADVTTATPLTPDATFRIASVTKSFTAAATLRLVEDHRLGLDDPIDRHLSAETLTPLRAGGYDVNAITIRHLLSHTSGLAGDYAQLPDYVEFVVENPQHHWTRAEQVEFVTTRTRPLSAPGAEEHYSDTGYILLGEVLERVTGATLAAAYRSLLHFDRLGLDETYLESVEPATPAAKPRAHQYLGELDATGWDPSFDIHGAGGLVSSLDDLGRFYRALIDGRILKRPAMLRTMLAERMGIDAWPMAGETCYGHVGFWGVGAYYCPRSRVTFANSITQADGFIPATVELFTHTYELTAGHGRRPHAP
jgi:D-alanyl-D-alanine carboxypeptidase